MINVGAGPSLLLETLIEEELEAGTRDVLDEKQLMNQRFAQAHRCFNIIDAKAQAPVELNFHIPCVSKTRKSMIKSIGMSRIERGTKLEAEIQVNNTVYGPKAQVSCPDQ